MSNSIITLKNIIMSHDPVLNPVIRTVMLFKRILTLTKGTHVTEDNSLSLLISFSNLNILSVERDQYARIISCFFHTITLIHILCLVTG